MDTVKITKLLEAHSSGDQSALDELIPLVYEHLRKMAHYRMQGERNSHTLNTTDLVHEAYLKLIKFDQIDWKGRAHFFAISSKVMRNVLVDYAVRKKAQKRGGERHRVTLGKQNISTEVKLEDILSIHQALERLAKIDERQAQVVECRYFGGLTLDETAKALDISTATVSRDWNMARAWLNREITEIERIP